MNKNYIFMGIATTVALYILLGNVSSAVANVFLTLTIILGAVVLVACFLFKKRLYQMSIYMVPKEHRLGSNAIQNSNCIVSYLAGSKIVVTDNITGTNCDKRAFTLQQGNIDIDSAWYKICKIFDKFSSVDSLATFFKLQTEVKIVNLNQDKPKKQVVNKETYRNPESRKPKQQIQTPEFVDFNNIQSKPIQQTTAEEEAGSNLEEFLSMSDILTNSTTKVNVNTATASEIAVLHGINIAIAKKIVEYRDLNGKFKTIDEFIQVAEVKEHFIPQIKKMVTLDETVKEPNDAKNEGRLLDW